MPNFSSLAGLEGGLKVPGGGVGWGGVEAHFSVQLKPKPS